MSRVNVMCCNGYENNPFIKITLQSIKDNCDDLKIWTEKDKEVQELLDSYYCKKLTEINRDVYKYVYIAYKLLYEYGGIWVEPDFLFHKKIPNFVEDEEFAQSLNLIGTGCSNRIVFNEILKFNPKNKDIENLIILWENKIKNGEFNCEFDSDFVVDSDIILKYKPNDDGCDFYTHLRMFSNLKYDNEYLRVNKMLGSWCNVKIKNILFIDDTVPQDYVNPFEKLIISNSRIIMAEGNTSNIICIIPTKHVKLVYDTLSKLDWFEQFKTDGNVFIFSKEFNI